ncbi:MAG: hypothetical protein KDE55_22870 [Novosphingobium sp.]|nr:hypothetical protein [Novosphingobium sp.]
MKPRIRELALAIGVIVSASAVPALAQKPVLAMLGQLQKGEWELRVRGDDASVRRICLGDAGRLIQLRHNAKGCDRLVVLDSADEVTVQYTCTGQGYGRTHIRRETNRLVQIDTQGIADGLPFSYALEARRVGTCRP